MKNRWELWICLIFGSAFSLYYLQIIAPPLMAAYITLKASCLNCLKLCQAVTGWSGIFHLKKRKGQYGFLISCMLMNQWPVGKIVCNQIIKHSALKHVARERSWGEHTAWLWIPSVLSTLNDFILCRWSIMLCHLFVSADIVKKITCDVTITEFDVHILWGFLTCLDFWAFLFIYLF